MFDGGLLATVQDAGRSGCGWMGVSPSGALDWFSARAANRLVGNDAAAALIETTLTGAEFELACDVRVAVTGADASLLVGGRICRTWCSYDARAGERIAIGAARLGLRSYLAFSGGIEVPLVLGSRSTDVGAGFGGFEGRSLRAGDRLALCPLPAEEGLPLPPLCHYAPESKPRFDAPAVLRTVAGPHAQHFTNAALERLWTQPYRVSDRASRQALRLEGEPLLVERPADIISCGMAAGCVQLASDGLPMLLLAEHQTTGGYAVAACVITADMPRAAQLRPGDVARFVKVTHAEAAAKLLQLRALLHSSKQARDLAFEHRLAQGFFEGT